MNCQKIADKLYGIQPEKWQNIKLYAQVTDESYVIFYYSKIGNDYIQSYDLPKYYDIKETEIDDVMSEIYNLILPDWIEKRWFVMTISLDVEGRFSIDYEYEDYSEDAFKYQANWEKRYLK